VSSASDTHLALAAAAAALFGAGCATTLTVAHAPEVPAMRDLRELAVVVSFDDGVIFEGRRLAGYVVTQASDPIEKEIPRCSSLAS